jgi:hypothetical protein
MNPRHRVSLNLCEKLRRLDRLVMRIRLSVVRAVCRALLPRDVWVGKHFGAYTQRWDVMLGRLDNRGVLQGLSDSDAGA